jgi:hypothetical protein
MLLIYSDPSAGPAPGSPELAAQLARWGTYTEELAKADALLAGEPLQPVDTATTVRVRDGKVLHTDGPFAETKEVLGGFYILDCKDLDEALAWAAKVPNVGYGSIEVRPIMEFSPGS